MAYFYAGPSHVWAEHFLLSESTIVLCFPPPAPSLPPPSLWIGCPLLILQTSFWLASHWSPLWPSHSKLSDPVCASSFPSVVISITQHCECWCMCSSSFFHYEHPKNQNGSHFLLPAFCLRILGTVEPWQILAEWIMTQVHSGLKIE